MGYGLELQQTQKLIMTPELRQAIMMLQLSSLELAEYLEQQVLENPVLELREEGTGKDEGDAEGAETFDVDWQEYFADSSDLGYPLNRVDRCAETAGYSYESVATRAPTLQEHLLLQLNLSVSDLRARRIGEFLIGNIDEHGYLRCEVDEAARILGENEREVAAVLRLVQDFDPPGVGARTVEECLTLQLSQMNMDDPVVRRVVSSHLGDLAQARYARIARALGVGVEAVEKACDVIRRLDPKPGRNFYPITEAAHIIPDVTVERVDGEYVIIVNDTMSPRLTINPFYRAVLNSQGECEAEARQFIRAKLNAAMWLIKSVEQRRMTLYRVVEAIVSLQRGFFDRGIKHLKPLTLKEVADVIGVHESTVSRATSNKYAQTPHGLFGLRFFFSSGLDDASGGRVSSETVKTMIRELIQQEDGHRPYSDQRVAEILGKKGIIISRRTVAKYREELSILSSAKRRRFQ